MAADSPIGWKSIDLHLENLIPGVLLYIELRALGVFSPFVSAAQGNALISSAGFVAGSYAIGLVSALVSRAVIDYISELGPRGWVFESLAHANRTAVIERLAGDERFLQDLKAEGRRFRLPLAAQWNAIYRWALRQNPSEEVKRRRAQGRLLRRLVIPISFGAAMVLRSWNVSYNSGWSWGVAVPLTTLAMTFIYAYAELMNMQEAYDITTAEPPAESKLSLPQPVDHA